MKINTSVNPKDARTEVRTLLRCNAQILFRDAPPMPARTVDISTKGICVIVPQDLARGQECGITFKTSIDGDQVEVNVVGKVVYSICVGTQGFRIGYQFTNVEPASRHAIDQLIFK